MLETRGSRLLVTQAAWMVGALGLLLISGRVGLETFFVVSLIGLVLAMFLYEPIGDRPGRWRLLRLVVLGCLLLFGYIVYRRFTAIGA